MHFETLATPLDRPNFNSQRQELVESDIESIQRIVSESKTPIEKISVRELKTALNKLKPNKAADVMNLTSEHFKYGGQCLESYLLNVMNYIISSQNISSVLKEGLLTPIYKKGDRSNPAHYRGITVTPVILKILEHILSERHNKILQTTQSKLQKGFTAGSSSMVVALILPECIYEAKNTKSTLFITALDAQKSFDAVDHKILLRKLCLDGIRGNDWLLLQN